MRGTFGLIGLVIVLALVGLLVKKQMAATTVPVPALQQGAPAATGSVRQQSQQVQDQVRQQMDALMQQARPMPEDAEK
jgi:type IV secretory pathway TrbF-like protein